MGDNTRERSEWSNAVAAQLRAERARRTWTREKMAQEAGIPLSTYRRMEIGERVADATQLARFCQAIGIPLSEFFHRVENEQNPESA